MAAIDISSGVNAFIGATQDRADAVARQAAQDRSRQQANATNLSQGIAGVYAANEGQSKEKEAEAAVRSLAKEKFGLDIPEGTPPKVAAEMLAEAGRAKRAEIERNASYGHDAAMEATRFTNRGLERQAVATERQGLDISAADAAAELAAPVEKPFSIMNSPPTMLPHQATPDDVLSRARAKPGKYGLSAINAARELVKPPPAPKPPAAPRTDPYGPEATASKIAVAQAGRAPAKVEKTDEEKIAFRVNLARALAGVKGGRPDPSESRRISSELTTKQGKIRLRDELRAKLTDPDNAASRPLIEGLMKELNDEIQTLGATGGPSGGGPIGAPPAPPAPDDEAVPGEDGGEDEGAADGPNADDMAYAEEQGLTWDPDTGTFVAK